MLDIRTETKARDALMEIRNILSYSVPRWFGKQAELDTRLPHFRSYPHSYIARFPLRNAGPETALLVKIGRVREMKSLKDVMASERMQDLARSEFAIMQSIWQAFDQSDAPGICAVRPLVYLEDWNAIVMNELDGQPLKNLLFSAPWDRTSKKQRLLTALVGAARWLRLFHRGPGGARLEPFPQAEAEKKVESFVEQLKQNSGGQVEVESLRKALFARLSTLSGMVPVAQLHGDYHYSNVMLVEDGRVCALDPRSPMRFGPVYTDLAKLLIDPETRPMQVITGGRSISDRFIQQARNIILENYFPVLDAQDEIDYPVLNFYCALSLLHKWGISEKILNAPGLEGQMAFVLRPLVRRQYGNLFNRYLGIRKGR